MDSENNNIQSFLNQNQDDSLQKTNQEEENKIEQEKANTNNNNLPQLLQNIEIVSFFKNFMMKYLLSF